MNKGPIYVSVLVLLFGCLFFGCEQNPGEKLYRKALSEWDKGNPVRARALLEKSIRRRAGQPENAEAYNRLGVLLWEMGNSKEAVQAFSESCRLNPGQYDPLCNLGVALCEQNDLPAAEQTFYEASLLNSKDFRPFAVLGTACAKNGRWDDAIRHINLVLKRAADDPKLQNALAITELHKGNTDAALRRLYAVAQKKPDYTPALFNIAAIYQYWVNNPAESKRWLTLYLSKAAADDPVAIRVRSGGLQAAVSSGGEEKIPFIPPSVLNRPASDQAFQKALGYHKKKEFALAAEWYIKALELDDTSEQVFYNLGLVYYATNRLKLAADAFSRAVQLNPALVPAHYNGALTAYRLGNNAQAVQSLEIILQQQPNYEPAIDLMNRVKAETEKP